LAEHFTLAGTRNIEFRAEIFSRFNTVNFSNPVGTIPEAIPNNRLTEVNRVQPGQPYIAAAAGTLDRSRAPASVVPQSRCVCDTNGIATRAHPPRSFVAVVLAIRGQSCAVVRRM
jgi:hypothetical protein